MDTISIRPRIDVHIEGNPNGNDFSQVHSKVLKPNDINGVNTLTQEMIDECGADTIFIIKHDYTLDGSITFPDNCVLDFEGGSFTGGIIVGNNTKIYNSYKSDILKGTSKQGTFIELNATDWEDISNKPDFATVATSGSYNDLTDKPSIPSGQVQSDWNQGNTSAVDFIKNKPTKLSDFTDDSNFVNGASYDSQSKRINLKHGSTVVAWIDAAPFIIDGMVDDVKIENGKLVVKFNTDAGKQNIEIPLTDIFNPNNYYTKAQVDTELDKKANASSLASVATSGNYNDLSNKPAIPVVPTNVSAFTNDAGYLTQHQDISGKQDKLTAGANITIVNNVISATGGGGGGGDYLPLSGGTLHGDLGFDSANGAQIEHTDGNTFWETISFYKNSGISLQSSDANIRISPQANNNGLDYNFGKGYLDIYHNDHYYTRISDNKIGVYYSDGDTETGTEIVHNSVTSGSFIKSGGTSAMFLKADGSIDSNSYALSSALNSYLPKNGGIVSGNLSVDGHSFSVYHDNGTNPVIQLQEFSDGSYTASIYLDKNDNMLHLSNDSGSGISLDSNVWASKFVKTGGTNSQFLKADGSVDSNTYITSSALANYLPLTGGTLTGALYIGTNQSSQSLFVHGVSNLLEGAYVSGEISIPYERGSEEDPETHTMTIGDGTIEIDNRTIIDETKVQANSFVVNGGTSSEFLKADGSTDSNTYLTSAAINDMATKTWVNQQDFITSAGSCANADTLDTHPASDFLMPKLYGQSILNNSVLVYSDMVGGWTNYSSTNFIANLGLATEDWVTNKGYITGITSSMITTALGYTPANGSDYLPLAGGTLTGSCSISGQIYVCAPQATGTVAEFYGGTDNPSGLVISTNPTGGADLKAWNYKEGTAKNISLNYGGGNVGVGTRTPSYKLDVNGSANIVGDLRLGQSENESHHFKIYSTASEYVDIHADVDGLYIICTHAESSQFNVSADDSYFSGDCMAANFHQTSDETLKNKVADVELTAEQIAEAPSIKFTWKDENKRKDVNVGTIAQYWQEILPEVVGKDRNDKLTLNYSALATVSVISLAKEVVELREKVSTLEERLEKLEKLMINN